MGIEVYTGKDLHLLAEEILSHPGVTEQQKLEAQGLREEGKMMMMKGMARARREEERLHLYTQERFNPPAPSDLYTPKGGTFEGTQKKSNDDGPDERPTQMSFTNGRLTDNKDNNSQLSLGSMNPWRIVDAATSPTTSTK